MKAGLKILGTGVNISCSLNELNNTVVFVVVLIPSTIYWLYSCKVLYKKFTSHSEKGCNKDEPIITPQVQKATDIKGDYADPSEGQLLGELIYRGDTVILYGTPGSGKTSAALQMAIDLSLGNPSKLTPPECDGGLHNPVHIIYYDMEMDDNDYGLFFGLFERSRLSNIDFCRGVFFQNSDSFVKDVERKIKNCNDDTVVFIDNASCIGISLNPDGIRKLFLKDFKRMKLDCERRGFTVTFVVITHTNKEKNIYGSSNLANFCSTMLKMERVPNEDRMILHVEKNRKYGAKQFTLKFCTIDGHKGFVNVGEIKQNEPEPPKKGTDKEPKFGNYTLSQVQELYELSQRQKPNPKGEGTVTYSSRDIAKAASFKISHAKVCDLIRQYKDYMAKNSTPEAESDDYVEYDEVE